MPTFLGSRMSVMHRRGFIHVRTQAYPKKCFHER